MKCPNCDEPIVAVIEFVLIGQVMCPRCGEVVSILNAREDTDEETMTYEKIIKEN